MSGEGSDSLRFDEIRTYYYLACNINEVLIHPVVRATLIPKDKATPKQNLSSENSEERIKK